MCDRSVVSLSNSSLNRFPNNSLTNFVHYLPDALHLDLTKRPHIALSTITLSQNLVHKNKATGYVKIHLKELSPQSVPTQGDSQCIARIPFSSFEKRDKRFQTLTHAVKNPIFLPFVTQNHITTLSYFITDEYNQQLKLRRGPPTIITLLIDEMHNNFSLTLSPATSFHQFNTNNDTDFHVSFPSPISLGKGWEVALHTVITPKGTFVEGDYYAAVKQGSDNIGERSWLQQDNDKPKKVRKNIKEFLRNFGITLSEYDGILYGQLLSAKYNVELILNANACKAFGLETYGFGIHQNFTWNNEYTEIGPINENAKETIELRENVAFYCDIVDNSHVGNVKAPLLDIVSSNSLGFFTTKNDTLFSLPNLLFRPVVKESFQTLQMSIRDLSGKPIRFNKEGNILDFIHVTLIFKRNISIK